MVSIDYLHWALKSVNDLFKGTEKSVFELEYDVSQTVSAQTLIAQLKSIWQIYIKQAYIFFLNF